MMAFRWLSAFFASLIIVLTTATGDAVANSKYAALVVHADTGDVLFDRYADDRRYPASLTKMMTVYMLFEALEEGEITMETKMKVSKRASQQPASKLGLRRGSTITVEEAINALVIKSANDVATVVAEELGGSETRFAREMTKKARELGMKRTTFRNASGLPNSKQVTTARDMAILSRRVIQDFPERFETFQRSSFSWNGRTYRSHNKVMLTLDGADGLKTGYTRASGYNLATTTLRGDHRLIGIVLGGRSGATRDRHMKDILNKAYLDIRRKPSLVNTILADRPAPRLKPGTPLPIDTLQGVTLASMAVPSPKPDADAVRLAAADPGQPGLPATLAFAEATASDLNLEGLELAINSVANDNRAIDEAAFGQGDADLSDRRDWLVQVGAYSQQRLALSRIEAMQEAVFAVQPEVRREVNITERGGREVFRARFTQLTALEAEEACRALKATGEDCLTLRVKGE